MFTVKIPATSANLGPCFDCAGLALSLYNEITVFSGEECEFSELFRIESRNEIDLRIACGQKIPLDETNLIYQTMLWFSRRTGRMLPRFLLQQTDRIPLARGLGSSAACIVGGLLIADLLLNTGYSRAELLNMAVEIEGHPDNVAPAFLGDMVVGVVQDSRFEYVSVPLSEALEFTVLIPDFPLSTSEARQVLPGSYTRAQAVFNASRSALLVGCLMSGKFDALSVAVQDQIHQPYRSRLIPGMSEILQKASEFGAYGGCLSGAGPTLMVIGKQGGGIADALCAFCETLPHFWLVQTLEPDRTGAVISEKI